MSWLAISPRDARALKIGAGAVVPILIFQFGIKPYASAMAVKTDALRSERALLARELRVIQERPRFGALEVDARRLLADTERQLFVGVDEVSASAALTRHVSDHARLAPVLIQQIETQAGQPLEESLVSIDVVVRGESDLEGILTFLRNLEFGDKLVSIPALRVEPVAVTGEPDADKPSVLGFTATLRGYVLLKGQVRGATVTPVGGRSG